MLSRGDDDVSQRVEQDGNDDGGGNDLRVEHLDWSGLEADGGRGKELLVQGEVLGGKAAVHVVFPATS